MKRFESLVSSKGVHASIMVILLLLTSFIYAKVEKSPDKGYLGVSVAKLSSAELKEMNLTHGIQVKTVVENEAAENAGIKEGDVIQYVDKNIIHTPGDLVDVVREKKPGNKVRIKLVRNNKQITVTATLGKLKPGEHYFFSPGNNKLHFFIGKKAYLGIQLRRLNDELSEYFGGKKDEGVLVIKVENDSPAKKAGMKAGDVIVRMGDQKISTLEDIHDFMDDHKSGDKVELTVIRHNKKKTIAVELGKKVGFRKFDILKWKSDGKAFIDIPEIHIPEFHIEIPDGEEYKIIIREKMDKVKEKLDRVKEKLHKKLKRIREYIYI